MRPLLIFLLGIIVGVGGMLFLPELTSRREQLSEETKKHLETLEGQVRDLGDQLKKINPRLRRPLQRIDGPALLLQNRSCNSPRWECPEADDHRKRIDCTGVKQD